MKIATLEKEKKLHCHKKKLLKIELRKDRTNDRKWNRAESAGSNKP